MMAKQIRVLGWVAVSSTMQMGEDKFSLEKQEADIREMCQRNDWYLVDLLKVPGFSRDYDNIIEAADAMRAEGITAFDDLRHHIERRSFNLFLVRDGDRFGRTLSLVAEVTAKIRRTGAQIYTLAGGLVDDKGATIWSAFAGLKAQGDIERLVEYKREGSIKKLQRGLPSGKPPFSHKLLRDERGKARKLVVNEDVRLICEDAARLLLEGMAWDLIERGLAKLGHQKLVRGFIYKLFNNPFFWGHAAYGRRLPGTSHVRAGLWCLDDSAPAPENVVIAYNTHEPMFTGEFAERVKAEIRRRAELIKGKARPSHTGIFTGLIICGVCGYMATLHRGTQPQNIYYGCLGVYSDRKNGGCIKRPYIHINTAQSEITELLLRPLLAGIDLEVLLQGDSHNSAIQREIGIVEQQIQSARERVTKLIRDRVRHQGLEEIYEEEIEKEARQLETLQQRLKELRARAEVAPVTEYQRRAALDIQSLDGFWSQDWTTINQQLHRLLGRYRLILSEGHLIGITML